MPDSVICRSETTYAEKPVALLWEGERLDISVILASWHTPQGKVFRVLLLDGRTFDLTYLSADNVWQIAPSAVLILPDLP